MCLTRILAAALLLTGIAHQAHAGARRSRPTKTGQTTCWDASNVVTSCTGTGQDGDLRRGEKRGYQDNGDGTIRDKRAALTWEKLSDDGSIHDKDNAYTWAQAFAKIDALNAAQFAGFADWRLPNLFELGTLVDLGAAYPAVPAQFATNCGANSSGNAGCTVLTCSCTLFGYAWSSSTYVDNPQFRWSVYFGDGSHTATTPSSTFSVRAVRGGS